MDNLKETTAGMMAFYNQNCLYFTLKAALSHEPRWFSFQFTTTLVQFNFVGHHSSPQLKTAKSRAIKPPLEMCYNALASDTF